VRWKLRELDDVFANEQGGRDGPTVVGGYEYPVGLEEWDGQGAGMEDLLGQCDLRACIVTHPI